MTTAPQFIDERPSDGAQLGKRRIMAVVLPQLLCELASTELALVSGQRTSGQLGQRLSGQRLSGQRLSGQRLSGQRLSGQRTSGQRLSGQGFLTQTPRRPALAFAVVVTNGEELSSRAPTLHSSLPSSGWLPGMGEGSSKAELQPKTRIDAVSHRARQFGVRPGQTVAEARGLLAELQFCELAGSRVHAALARIADSLSRFASIVSFDEEICQSSEQSRGKSGTRSGSKSSPSNQRSRSMGTVWLDITGIGHLFGGERELSREVMSTVQALGHHVRVAVANGPVLAQALACWPTRDQTLQVLNDEQVKEAVRWLPITALPVDVETQTWLARLGVLTFADLEKIPRHLAASRLGESSRWGKPANGRGGKTSGASRILDLLEGKDDEPLRAYVPQALPVESVSWDEPITGSEPLLFALRGLVAKVCDRLDGRGLAARRIRVTVTGDRAMAKFHAARADWHSEFELVTPLYRADELLKVMSPRVSRAPLETPSIGLRLEVLELATRQERQLSLVSADTKLEGASPEKMAVLFGSLAAEIGAHNFGLLTVVDSHRPERRSVLQPLEKTVGVAGAQVNPGRGKRVSRRARESEFEVDTLQTLLPGMDGRPSNDVVFGDGEAPPTRLVEPPLLIEQPLLERSEQALLEQPEQAQSIEQALLEGQPRRSAFEVGASLRIGQELYTIEKSEFVHRIDGVEWWSKAPASRDYFRVWLAVFWCGGTPLVHAGGALDALVFVDRSNGKRYVQGFYD